MAKVAGATPSHRMLSNTSGHGCGTNHPDSTPTRHSTGMASGQPSISSTRQAPDHCSCTGAMCRRGSAHIQGRSTSVASTGVSSAPPRSIRQGRRASEMPSAIRTM